MRRVRSKDTGPEMVVRRLAHGLGCRFRLHRSDLPGKPDLVFPRLGRVILVHGCFWHGHQGCKAAKKPKDNAAYWLPKLERNIKRDAANINKLEELGWKVLVVWECQTRDSERLRQILDEFLGGQ